MTREKQARIGQVQREFVNELRAELLRQSGSYDAMDMSFTDGVNFAIAIAMCHLAAPKYRDLATADGEEMPTPDAAADLAAGYIENGDLPNVSKREYAGQAQSFITTTVQALLYDGIGLPDDEWLDEHSMDEETFYDSVMTAESPDAAGGDE